MTTLASRRGLILGATASAAATTALSGAASAAARPPRRAQVAYVGCRTTRQRNARGVGITVWRVPAAVGRPWKLLQTVPADDADPSTETPADAVPINPSFLALSADEAFLYAVHGDSSLVSAFAVDPADGTLTLLNTVDGGQMNPVHLVVDPSGRWLIVAFFAVPGAVLVFPRNDDGSLGALASRLDLPGTPGPHKTQQLGPNPHHVVFDPSGRWLTIPDRGLDRVFVAGFGVETGVLTLNDPGWAQFRELEGPRHIAFHPWRPLAYVITEIRSCLTTCDWDAVGGVLRPRHVVPSQPFTFVRDTRAAEIAVSPSGRYVYGSNRSGAGDAVPGGPEPDTIGIFEVSGAGNLDPVRWVSTEGLRPRFFGIEPQGRQLFVANEATDTIVGYAIDDRGRRLRSTGTAAATGSPTTLVWRASAQT